MKGFSDWIWICTSQISSCSPIPLFIMWPNNTGSFFLIHELNFCLVTWHSLLLLGHYSYSHHFCSLTKNVLRHSKWWYWQLTVLNQRYMMMLLLKLMLMLHDADAATFILIEWYIVVVKTDTTQVTTLIRQNILAKYVLMSPVHGYTRRSHSAFSFLCYFTLCLYASTSTLMACAH